MKIAVIGAGAGGLAASLALARRGHEVVLIERDKLVPTDGWEDSLEAKRSIPQYLLPHGLLARARKVLFENARDVYDALIGAGAIEIDMCARLPDVHKDPELVGLGARRPLLEWALTRAVRSEPLIEVRDATKVSSLDGSRSCIDGVVTATARIRADLVIDATGRASGLPTWLEDLGAPRLHERSSDCGSIGYARYFRLLPGADIPPILSPVSATGDTGYMSFGIFWHDNGTFATVLTTPSWDRELRVLRREGAHMACARSMPPLRRFVEPSTSEPFTGVLPNGGLQNTHREWFVGDVPVVSGVLPIGDALCHTNPNYAYGLSLALAQAFMLPDLIERAEGPVDLAQRFHEATGSELAQRYRFASLADEGRQRTWKGEQQDFGPQARNLPFFLFRALPLAAISDPSIYARAMRLVHVLDQPDLIERDEEFLWKVSELYRERTAARPPAFPSRGDLQHVLNEPVTAS